jgi:hypothetical protein
LGKIRITEGNKLNRPAIGSFMERDKEKTNKTEKNA